MKEAQIIPLFKFKSDALPFKVQTIKNFAEEQDDTNETPHSHNHYEMVWVTRGKGMLYIDMREYVVDDNTIFCLKPNQVHQFQVQPGMDGFVFSFADSFTTDEYDFGWTGQ